MPDSPAAEDESTVWLAIERAKSGRSTCVSSGEPIPAGTPRVRMLSWRMGRQCFSYQKPEAFVAENLRLEYAPTGQSACKISGRKLAKGALRIRFHSGATTNFTSLNDGAPLARLLLAAVGKGAADVVGVDELSREDAKRAQAVLEPKRADRAAVKEALGPEPSEAANAKAHPDEDGRLVASPAGDEAGRDKGKRNRRATTPGTRGSTESGARTRKRTRASAGDSDAEDQGVDASGEASSGHLPTGLEQQAQVGGEELNAYERERLANIERNRALMAELGLLEDAASVKEDARGARQGPLRSRGLAPAARTKAEKEVLPPRKSMRQQGKTPDGAFAAGVHEERADGSVVVMVEGEAVRYSAAQARRLGLDGSVGSAADDSAREHAKQARLRADLPFESLNAKPSTDAAFLRALASAQALPASRGPKEDAARAPCLGALVETSLAEGRVAKVTKRDVVHIAFQPRADSLLLSVADKAGHLAFWDVAKAEAAETRAAARAEALETMEAGEEAEGTADAEEDEDGAQDGVLLLGPHSQYVSGLRWSKERSSRLFTASYEGTIRCLDVGRLGENPTAASAGNSPTAGCGFQLVYRTEDHEISAFEINGAGTVAYFADNHGAFRVVDTRARAPAESFTNGALALHDRKVNQLSLEPMSEVALASCSTDSTVAIWDVRKLGPKCKPLRSLVHPKSCQAAQWAPDGSARLLTTCYDNTLRVWSGMEGDVSGGSGEEPKGRKSGGKPEALAIRHNTNTGRWIVPFRAVWTSGGDGILVGSMNRQVHLINAATGKLAKGFGSDFMSAIPARNAAHPTVCAFAGGTASGRVHVFVAAE